MYNVAFTDCESAQSELIKILAQGEDLGEFVEEQKFVIAALEAEREGAEYDRENGIVYDSTILNSNAYCLIRKILELDNNLFSKLLDDFKLGENEVNIKFAAKKMNGIYTGTEGYTDANDLESSNYIYLFG